MFNKYELMEKIGAGSFGSIHKAKNIRTGELVAIKMESIQDSKLLVNETKVYQYLAPGKGIPQIKWFGRDDTNYYMVMTLLGDSLTTIKTKWPKLKLNVVCQIGVQLIERVKYVHELGLIHRDIKPDNFLMGKENIIYLIDFGFCKKYMKNAKHIEERKTNSIIGTPTFVSINVHEFCEPSRRDDIESIAYVVLYLYLDDLEWKKMKNVDDIKSEKMKIRNNEKIPQQFRDLVSYARSLKFEETPNYEYIMDLIRS
jgi:serine/threonine protein kinase